MAITVARQRLQQWPGASNTGVPAGVSLTPNVGNLDTSASGQVIDAVHVQNGAIIVHHANVTIRRTKVTADATVLGGCIIIDDGKQGTLIEDCELDGGGNGISGVFAGEVMIVRRCNIHGVGDGIDPGIIGPTRIQDNWIHSLSAVGGDPHSDGIQLVENTSDMVIVHNFIDSAFPILGTSAIICAQPSFFNNVHIVGNRMWGGGATFYVPEAPNTKTYFNYNRLAYWDFFPVDGVTADLTEYIGNVNDLTGAAI